MLNLDFSFTKKYLKSQTVAIDNFTIDVKFKHWEQIKHARHIALSAGQINLKTIDIQREVPAKITHNNDTYSVSLSLTGQTNAHIEDPDKWSLAVKVKNNKTIMGMKKFAMLIPRGRGYLTDYMATKMLETQNIIAGRINYVNIHINGKNNGLYYLEERFDKRLLENNQRREGIICKYVDGELKIYSLKSINKNRELSSQLTLLRTLFHNFLNDKISANQIFDLEKFASLYAVCDIMNSKHPLFPSNLRLYFNPITMLIEPIAREWGYLRYDLPTSISIEKPLYAGDYHTSLHNNFLLNKIHHSLVFKEHYIKQAKILTHPNYLKNLIQSHKSEIDLLLNKIYKHNPFYIFPKKLISKNQNYIRKKLSPIAPCIDVLYTKKDKNNIHLYANNNIELPIEIHAYKYNDTEIRPKERTLLEANYRTKNKDQQIVIPLPKNKVFQNFSPELLEVRYSILGINKTKSTFVSPYKLSPNVYASINRPYQQENINDFSFLDIDHAAKTITFKTKQCDLHSEMIIPKGYTVVAKPGCQINLTENAKIISYSPFIFIGKENEPIVITSSDKQGQGIVLYNCNNTSILSYVSFTQLSNVNHSSWQLRGAITFYRSPINIDHCSFEDNVQGDDYLNIIQSDFILQNSTFSNTKSDAFDADFSNGAIKNLNFTTIGNDGIDVSGSKVNITNVEMKSIGDKGISAGEKSVIIGNNLHIEDAEIGICSKDLSTVTIDKIIIKQSQIGLSAFQKKSEFGPSTIIGSNIHINNVSVPYLIEKESTCTIDQVDKLSNSDKVKALLYGVKYGKSSK